MRRSIRKFNIPPGMGNPRGNTPDIWTFEDWLVQILSPRGKKAVQMPHQLLLKYLSSRTNFVFNQTLYTLFREICRNDIFWKTLLKELFTDKEEILSIKSVKPCKKTKNSRHITSEQEINPVQIPHSSNATFKFPPPRALCTVKCPDYTPGGGCWSFELIGALQGSPDPSQMSRIIYKAGCWDCNEFYIGKTKRRLHDRKTEHFKALSKCDHTSAIADHMKTTGHNIIWDHFDILASGKTDFTFIVK